MDIVLRGVFTAVYAFGPLNRLERIAGLAEESGAVDLGCGPKAKTGAAAGKNPEESRVKAEFRRTIVCWE